jgi:hypothetical protein
MRVQKLGAQKSYDQESHDQELREELRAHEFRTRAAECQALARRIRDLELKRLSQELARQWLELAEQAEKSSRH